MTSTEIAIKATGEVATHDAVNQYLTKILMSMPEPTEGDDLGILVQLINATEVDDLDSPWSSAGMKKFVDHVIEVESIKRMESTKGGKLGWYLLAEGRIVESGEYRAFSTSSVAIMTQLLVAYERGMLPLEVYVRIARTPTKRGFYPMHLEIYRGGDLYDPPAPSDAPADYRPGSAASNIREKIRAKAAANQASNQGATATAGSEGPEY